MGSAQHSTEENDLAPTPIVVYAEQSSYLQFVAFSRRFVKTTHRALVTHCTEVISMTKFLQSSYSQWNSAALAARSTMCIAFSSTCVWSSCRRRREFRTLISSCVHNVRHPAPPLAGPRRFHVVPFRRNELREMSQNCICDSLSRLLRNIFTIKLPSILILSRGSVTLNKNVAEPTTSNLLVTVLTNHQTTLIVPFHVIALVRIDPQ